MVACEVLASIGCGVVGVLLFAVLWVVAPASEVVVCVGLLCALMGSLSCVLVFGCNLYADLSMAASAVVVQIIRGSAVQQLLSGSSCGGGCVAELWWLCVGSCAAAREWRKAAAGQAAAFMEAGGGGLQAEHKPATTSTAQPRPTNSTNLAKHNHKLSTIITN